MHRVDIARATGSPLAGTGAEAEVVAQVVRDLDGGSTGSALTLALTGHGAVHWQVGPGSPAAAHCTGDTRIDVTAAAPWRRVLKLAACHPPVPAAWQGPSEPGTGGWAEPSQPAGRLRGRHGWPSAR